jgi:CHAT domain-containing protein
MDLRFLYPLFLFISLSFFNLTQAQTAESSSPGLELYYSAMAMFDSAEYEMAALFFEQARDEFRYADEWGYYANATEGYASAFHARGIHQKALAILEDGIDSVEKHLGAESFFTGTLYNSLGAVYYYQGECRKAFPRIKKGIEIMAAVEPNHPSLAMAYNNLGLCADIVEDLESALRYFNKSLSLFLDRYGEEHERVAMACTNIGWTHSALGDYDKQGQYYQRSLEIRRKIYGGKHVKLIPNYINIGAYHFRRGNYAKMFEYSRKALRNIEENQYYPNPYLSTIYLNHAQYYDAIKDYQAATPFYIKAIEEDTKARGLYHPNLAVSYFNLADNYNYLGDHANALINYRRGREICERSQGVNILDEANGYRTGGRIWESQQDYDKAIALFFKALNIYRNQVEKNHPRIRHILLEIASAYGKMNDRSRQLDMYQEAIRQYFSSKNSDSTNLGEIYLQLAYFYADTGPVDSARFYTDKCLHLFYRPLIESDFTQLPSWNEMAFPREMIELLKLQASLEMKRADESALRKGLRSYLLAAQIIDSIRFNQASFSGKRDLGAIAKSVYEGGIQVSHALEKLTGSPTYFDQAFMFAERGKSTLLYQSIQEAEARISAGIPDSIYAMEAEIKLSLMFYRNKVNEIANPQDPENIKKIALWREKIFNLNQKKDSLISRLEKDYPRYFELKYTTKIPSVAEIQALLKAQGASLINYFEGTEQLFVFRVSASEKSLHILKKDIPLDAWIDSFRQSIYRPFTGGAMNDSLNLVMQEQYAEYGHKLFQFLFPESLRSHTFSGQKLIVVPDGNLGYLPFGALLTQKPERLGRYRSYPFLIKLISLSYSYSAALCYHDYQPRQFPLPRKKMIAFSPNFKQNEGSRVVSSRSELGELAFSKAEVEAVKESLGGEILLDDEATEKRFKALAGDYQMIHISSHAMVNDQKPLRSQIAFSPSPDTTEDHFLSLEELFHLKLPAEMVVLSACETGIGKLFQGEGISSLARGFSYAGARSIITTLWKVNDEATAQIMAGFYQYLNQGMHKEEALSRAKLSYLEQADNLTAHPFYWSGHVPIGNMEPVLTDDFSWRWLFILLAIFMGVFVVKITRGGRLK